MSAEDKLTAALIETYRTTGKAIGYWARYFLRKVKAKGGLATARDMLRPRSAAQRAGLDRLLDANRPDLTLEAVIQRQEFRALFTPSELKIAAERLAGHKAEAKKRASNREHLDPNELSPGVEYTEGAKKRIVVNAYERNRKARDVCLKHYGYRCVVCDFDFEAVYGGLGKAFAHVHHLKPLALTDAAYKLDPIADLRPVCPNCHAMLHRRDGLLSIAQLRQRLLSAVGKK